MKNKQLTYFVEFDGAFVCLGTEISAVENWMKQNLEDDDEQVFKVQYMTEEEREALPEADL